MATDHNNEDVKEFVERIDISGNSGSGDADDEEIITPPDSSTGSNDAGNDEEGDAEKADDTDTSKPDELVKKPAGEKTDEKEKDAAPVPGETPRERALRQQLEITRKKLRQEKFGDLDVKSNATAKEEISPEKKKILERYKPEDLASLKEVIDVMADDMGFVRKDQLGANTYAEKAGAELDSFIESHPEYLPENDHDNILWDAFKTEYQLYKQPSNPKDFKKIFERVHEKVFGIKPAGDSKKLNAAKEKIQVASHSGASKPAPSTNKGKTPTGLRLDMLQGFSDEEKAEMENRAG